MSICPFYEGGFCHVKTSKDHTVKVFGRSAKKRRTVQSVYLHRTTFGKPKECDFVTPNFVDYINCLNFKLIYNITCKKCFFGYGVNTQCLLLKTPPTSVDASCMFFVDFELRFGEPKKLKNIQILLKTLSVREIRRRLAESNGFKVRMDEKDMELVRKYVKKNPEIFPPFLFSGIDPRLRK